MDARPFLRGAPRGVQPLGRDLRIGVLEGEDEL